MDSSNVEKASLLIGWLQVLCNGRIKPDDPSKKGGSSVDPNNPCCNETGVVRESKDFVGKINEINEELSSILLVIKNYKA